MFRTAEIVGSPEDFGDMWGEQCGRGIISVVDIQELLGGAAPTCTPPTKLVSVGSRVISWAPFAEVNRQITIHALHKACTVHEVLDV
jgi:hypothetical protein